MTHRFSYELPLITGRIMDNIFLVPGEKSNFAATIEKPVPLDKLRQFISEDKISKLIAKTGVNKPIYCWAFKSGLFNDSKYEQMQEGDLVLFRPNKKEIISHLATVSYKIESISLADALWPIRAESPWKLIYFLRNIKVLNINFSTFKKELGFSDKLALQGTIRLSPDKIQAVEVKYGSFMDFLEKINGTPIPVEGGKSTPEIPVFVRRESGRISRIVHSDVNKFPELINPPEPTKSFETFKPDKDMLIGLLNLDREITVLKNDKDHKERAHESLVEKFFNILGYTSHSEIKFQQGRIDVFIDIKGKPGIVVEVKKDWSLTKNDKKTLQQAFNYSFEIGAIIAVITNGDYYAVFNKGKGLSYDDSFVGEFRISECNRSEFSVPNCLKKQ